jgi:hypothetical protein
MYIVNPVCALNSRTPSPPTKPSMRVARWCHHAPCLYVLPLYSVSPVCLELTHASPPTKPPDAGARYVTRSSLRLLACILSTLAIALNSARPHPHRPNRQMRVSGWCLLPCCLQMCICILSNPVLLLELTPRRLHRPNHRMRGCLLMSCTLPCLYVFLYVYCQPCVC